MLDGHPMSAEERYAEALRRATPRDAVAIVLAGKYAVGEAFIFRDKADEVLSELRRRGLITE